MDKSRPSKKASCFWTGKLAICRVMADNVATILQKSICLAKTDAMEMRTAYLLHASV